MANLVKNVAVGDDSDDLDAHDNDDFSHIDRWNVAVPHCQHGSQSKVEGVNVFFQRLNILEVVDNKPVMVCVVKGDQVKDDGEDVGDGKQSGEELCNPEDIFVGSGDDFEPNIFFDFLTTFVKKKCDDKI